MVTAVMEPQWWVRDKCPPLVQIVSECVEAKRRANRRDCYVEELKRSLNLFVQGRESMDLRNISPEDIEGYFLEKDFSAATRATVITRLGALFSFAERKGYIAHNPVRRLDRIAVDRPPPIILSPDDARQLLTTTRNREPEMIAYVVIGLFAGVRAAELNKLTWSDVEPKCIKIDAATSKVRRRRIVPLHPIAEAWLNEIGRHFPIYPGRSKSHRLARLAALMGWDEWPRNLLRHSCASYSLALYRDAGRVSMALGNTPQVLLTHYYELVNLQDCAKFWSLHP